MGPCRLREVQFKLGRKRTAYYDVLVEKGVLTDRTFLRCALGPVQLFEDDWASRTAELVGSAQAVINDLQRILS